MIIEHRHRPFPSGEYAAPTEFVADAQLMFDNALAFNEPGSVLHSDAAELRAVFSEAVAALPALTR